MAELKSGSWAKEGRWVSKRLIFIGMLGLFSLAQAAVSVFDDAGNRVRLLQPAKRIVSLAPHVTELLFAAGAGESLVGTVEYSDYPVAARNLPLVGGYSRIDLEAVIALSPDLIVAWESGNPTGDVEKLRSLGFQVYLSQPDSIEDVAVSIERFGVLSGSSITASSAANRFRERLARLRKQYSERSSVDTFYQIWNKPMKTVGGKQIISEVIRLCGGRNVFFRLDTFAPTVSVEAVISANPEVIIGSGMGGASAKLRPPWLDDWKYWRSVTAVARDNLFYIPPDLIQRHTPRLLDGAELLCQQLEVARSRRVAR